MSLCENVSQGVIETVSLIALKKNSKPALADICLQPANSSMRSKSDTDLRARTHTHTPHGQHVKGVMCRALLQESQHIGCYYRYLCGQDTVLMMSERGVSSSSRHSSACVCLCVWSGASFVTWSDLDGREGTVGEGRRRRRRRNGEV